MQFIKSPVDFSISVDRNTEHSSHKNNNSNQVTTNLNFESHDVLWSMAINYVGCPNLISIILCRRYCGECCAAVFHTICSTAGYAGNETIGMRMCRREATSRGVEQIAQVSHLTSNVSNWWNSSGAVTSCRTDITAVSSRSSLSPALITRYCLPMMHFTFFATYKCNVVPVSFFVGAQMLKIWMWRNGILHRMYSDGYVSSSGKKKFQ